MDASRVAALLDSGRRFLTLGGVETYLIFQQGVTLREFAAFEVCEDEDVYRTYLERHVEPIVDAAARHGHGVLLDCMVYKAAPDPLEKLGYPPGDVVRINRDAVTRQREFIDAWRARSGKTEQEVPMLVAGDLGPRGDGYGRRGDEPASVEEARSYHDAQIGALAGAGVDLLVAYTQTNVAEAAGIALAAKDHAVPLAISATIETDGRLPDGTALGDFIREVDAATQAYPVFYMVNCAHPLHVQPAVEAAAGESWLSRLRGLRANASSKSHAELDESPTLDRGDPADFGRRVARLAQATSLAVVGGCCGTDAEHLVCVAEGCA